MPAQEGADSPESGAGVASSPAEHLARLDRLIAEQADELAALNTTLLELRALCDLAEWAHDTENDDPAMVRVEDLRRILSRPASHPVPPGT